MIAYITTPDKFILSRSRAMQKAKKRKIKRKQLVKNGQLAKAMPLSYWKEKAKALRWQRVQIENKWKFGGKCEICMWKYSQGLIQNIHVNRGIEVCHAVRRARGNFALLERTNLYWGCRECNAGDHFHPGLYQEYHKKMIGPKTYEEIERTKKKYEVSDYQNMIDEDKEAIKWFSLAPRGG